jgi:hypothetical protein
MNKPAYERLPRDLKTVIDGNSGQVAAGMAGAMWDLEAAAVAALAREHGDLIVVLSAEEAAPWRKATEPVIAAWLKEAKGRKIDGGKLIASARALVAKYASEPEPQAPQPAQPPQSSQPPEQKIVIERQPPQPPQPPQAKAEITAMPKAEAPAAAPPAKRIPLKALDIPL